MHPVSVALVMVVDYGILQMAVDHKFVGKSFLSHDKWESQL